MSVYIWFGLLVYLFAQLLIVISVASPVTNFAKSSIAVLYTFGTQDGRLGFTILGLSTFLYVAFVSYSTITVRSTSRMLPSSRKVVSGVIRTKLPLRLYVYVCMYVLCRIGQYDTTPPATAAYAASRFWTLSTTGVYARFLQYF